MRGNGAELEARSRTRQQAKDLRTYTAPLVTALEAFCEEQRAHRPQAAVRWIEGGTAEEAARIALRVALTGYKQDKDRPGRPELPLTRAARKVADALRVEAVARQVEQATGRRIKDHTRDRPAVVRREAKAAGIGWPRWNRGDPLNGVEGKPVKGEAIKVGHRILNILADTLGVVEIERHGKHGYLIRPTPEAWDLLRHYATDFWPVNAPMIELPRSWRSTRGRYRHDMEGSLSLVRGRPKYGRKKLPHVRRALDRVQATGWKINGPILDLAREVWEAGGGRYGLPVRDRAKASERVRVDRTLFMAEELGGSVLYFPHNCDWRGRIYTASDWLTPQGADIARALLLFEEGKPLGEAGAYWLAVHGANCFGIGGTFDDRAQWIAEHDAELEKRAEAAKEPLRAAAFVREWRAYQEEGPGYVSHLPIALDGSCNGLQHFAALFRDEVTAAAVNLLPSDRPADFYGEIAARVSWPTDPAWQLVTLQGEPIGRAGDPIGLSRDQAKRPVMTFGYGATEPGLRSQLMGAVLDADDYLWMSFAVEGDINPLWSATGKVARAILAAMDDVAPKVAAGREWLQEVARTIAKSGQPVRWRVPVTGFPVRQSGREYWRREKWRNDVGDGRRLIEWHVKTPRRLDVTKHVNSIAPNVIHSLDAAALVLTIRAGASINSWGVVHDSYQVLAADVPALRDAARRGFWRLYNRPVLEEITEQFRGQAPGIPEPPELGDYEIGDVLEADYFIG